MKVYLDHAATTPLDNEVLKEMMPYFYERFGNASSIHQFGREANEALEKARARIAKKLNAKPEEVIFTSGGTESNNFAIKGVAFANKDKGKHIVTTQIEHECILNACKWLEQNGFTITYLKPDKNGVIKPEVVEESIKKNTILVSIIHANNEIGVLQDIKEISKICKEKQVYFHTDACQSFCKTQINMKKMNVDMITINAHKIYGPKGVGALVIREGTKIQPLLHGGGHEFGKRSGTENVAGIVGFAAATKVIKSQHIKQMRKLSDFMKREILNQINYVIQNGNDNRICNIINLSFKGIEGESLVLRLDAHHIACSTGSACSSHSLEPSHVIMAITNNPERAHSSVRFSLGKDNTKEQIEYVLNVLKIEVNALRKIGNINDQCMKKLGW